MKLFFLLEMFKKFFGFVAFFIIYEKKIFNVLLRINLKKTDGKISTRMRILHGNSNSKSNWNFKIGISSLIIPLVRFSGWIKM